MGSEIGVLGIKDRQLQRINDAADRINDAAGEQPEESGERKRMQQLSEYENADPSHCNVDDRGKPFRTGDPAGLDCHADKRDAPDNGKKRIAEPAAEYDQADRRVGACDQHKDHHMIDFAKYAQRPAGDVDGVV